MTRKSLNAVLLIIVLLFSSIVIVVPSTVRADSTDGTYNYTVNGGQATITAYVGSGVAITIPATLGTYPVVAIANSAFTGVNSVTSVTIPSNINLIGNAAFLGCNNLVSITVDGANTHYASVGGVLYTHDLTTLVNYPRAMAGSYFDIPEGVTTIGDQAFHSAKYLTSVTLSESISSVGNQPFLLCSLLTNVGVVPENPYFASNGGVLYTHDLTTLVVYPNGQTAATFTVPSYVTKIGAYSFCGCRPTTVIMLSNVRSIMDHAFDQCALTSVTIPDSVTSIGNYSFNNMVNLLSASIGNGAKYVGQYAFYWCFRMTSVSIGRNVTSIGTCAFGNCPLSSVIIPANVTSIGSGAFWQAHITSVTIPGKVRSIGDFAFKDCVSLTSVRIPNGTLTFGNQTFSGCSELSSAVIGNGSTIIGQQAFYNCPLLTSVFLGANVTNIDNSAFQGCLGLTSITIPGKVTRIGTSAFQSCSGLSSIKFLGLVAPTSVAGNWIQGTNAAILGRAYQESNFPVPGQSFNGLLMGGNIPEAPGAPTNLVALAGNAQITLNWTAPTRTSGYTIDYYEVFQNGVWTGEQITALNKVIPGLTNRLSYTFTVRAHTAMGLSVDSNTASATPSNPPHVPTGLKAVSGNAQATLNWTAPSNNGGSAVDHYIVYRNGTALPTHYTGTTATVTNLINGAVYTFTVIAHNLGGYSDNSSAAMVTPLTFADAPTGLTGVPGRTSVSLSWTSPTNNGGATVNYYLVEQKINDVWTVVANVTGTSAVVAGLSSGQSYEFAVAAHTILGLGNKSIAISASPGIYITVDASASAPYVNGATAGTVTVSVSAISSLPSITLATANVSHYVNGVLVSNTVIAVSGSSYSSTAALALAVGTNVMAYTFNDSAGNTLTKSITVVYDTVAPTIRVLSPSAGSWNNTGSVKVAWQADDGLSGIAAFSVSIVGRASTFITHGTSYTFTDLSDGAYTIVIGVVDNAGNTNGASVTFTVDTHAPTAIVVPSGSNVALNAVIAASFSEAMNPDSVGIAVNHGVDGAVALVGNNATFTPSSELRYDTEYTVTVSGQDLAGNPLTKIVSFTTMKDEGVINGVVKDANGNVIAGATVALSNGITTTTDASGAFSFSNVTAGSYTVTVSGNGYQPFTRSASTIAGETTDLGPLTVQASPAVPSDNDQGVISGVIKDVKGNVIANAAVTLSNGMTTTTDANGAFSFSNVTAGSYNLTVSNDGYQTFTQSVASTAGGTTVIGLVSLQTSPSAPASSNDALVFGILGIAIIAMLAILFLFVRRRKKQE